MGLANLSIVGAEGATSPRQRIAEPKPERSRGSEAEAAKPQRGAERTQLRSRQSEEGSLTLTTAEGDKVTISFRNQQSTKVDQAKLYGPDGAVESTKVRSRESSELSVSLEGQLSEAELKDIGALVAELSAGIASGGQRFEKSGELGSIDSYSFAYQQSSDVRFRATRLSVTA